MHTRIATLLLLLAPAAVLAGCGPRPDGIVRLTRMDSAAVGPGVVQFAAARMVFATDASGRYDILVEAVPEKSPSVLRQWLCIRVLWPINATRNGTDPTALNAHVGYLLQADQGTPAACTLFYEGTGNVYVDKPMWMGGQRRFLLRQAILKLSKSDRAQPADPLGPVRVDAALAGAADPDATAAIEPIAKIIDSLIAPAPATQPE